MVDFTDESCVRFLVGQSTQMRKSRTRFDGAQSFIAPSNAGTLNQMAGEKLKSKRVRRRQVKHMFNPCVISLPCHHQGVE